MRPQLALLRPVLDRNVTWVLACGAGVVAGAVAEARPIAVVLLGAAIVTVIALVLRPELAIHATIAVAFATLPTGLPSGLHPGPFVVRIYEPFLAVAVVYTVARCRPAPLAERAVLALAGAVVLAGLVGSLGSADPVQLVDEAQLLLDLAAGYYVAAGVVRHGRARAALRTVTAVLWWSAGVLVAASVGLVEVSGRTETAHLGDATSGAVRLLTATQFLALAVLCGVTALLATGRAPVRALLLPAAPAVLIVVLAFSRNTLLALGVCLLVAVAIGGARAIGRTTLAAALAAALLTPAVLLGGELLAGTRLGAWLGTQASAYGLRVLGGLTSRSVEQDPSLRYRSEETVSLLDRFRDSPVVGHGLGYAYHRPTGESGSFSAGVAPYYAHDFWLWLVVKAGLLGGAAVTAALTVPAAIALFQGRTEAGPIAAGCASVALLAVCVVSPLPLDSPTSLLLGGVVGGAAGWVSRGAGTGEPADPPAEPPTTEVVIGARHAR